MELFRKVIFCLYSAAFITRVYGACFLHTRNSIVPIYTVCCSEVNDANLAPVIITLTSGNDTKINRFRLEHFESVKLGKNSTGGVSFEIIILVDNPNLTDIHPLAFQASADTATEFRVLASPSLGSCALDVVKNMPLVEILRLINVGLSKVPAGAFKSNKKLSQILLSENSITSFKAPLSGHDMILLDLSNNNLNVDSFPLDVFKDLKGLLLLYIYNNEGMNILPQKVFQSVLDLKTCITVGRKDPSAKNPYMICKGQEWLCNYASSLTGYICADVEGAGGELWSMFRYCRSLVQQKNNLST